MQGTHLLRLMDAMEGVGDIYADGRKVVAIKVKIKDCNEYPEEVELHLETEEKGAIE